MMTTLSIFYFYAFAGWTVEVIYAAVTLGKFVNRGFMYGAVCPIYGFGVLFVVSSLESVADNIPLTFICAVLLTSLLELITGYIMERLFRQRWWDYSDLPFNIGGYVCLKFSLIWGLACVFVVEAAHPVVLRVIDAIPDVLLAVILTAVSAVFITDLVLTVIKITKLNKKLRRLDAISSALTAMSDRIGSEVADTAINISEKSGSLAVQGALMRSELRDMKDSLLDKTDELHVKVHDEFNDLQDKTADELAELKAELTERIALEQKRWLDAFPKLRSVNYDEIWDAIRDKLNTLKK